MHSDIQPGKQLILASQSPRRKALLEQLGLEFEVQPLHVDEVFSEDLPVREVPEYLSRLKAEAFPFSEDSNELVITADTAVILGDSILNKPADRTEAVAMLESLSGNQHEVITGVTFRTKNQQRSFSETTTVTFSELTSEVIDHYIDTFKPYDKAGSYGIQEWIGYVGVSRIEGCYYNVVGLPLHRMYTELKEFGL